jgi:hypothetical protein
VIGLALVRARSRVKARVSAFSANVNLISRNDDNGLVLGLVLELVLGLVLELVLGLVLGLSCCVLGLSRCVLGLSRSMLGFSTLPHFQK